MNVFRAIGLVAGSLCLCMSFAAQAQIEQVIVTATKRAENRQGVPITVQAISGDELHDRGVDTAEDVLSLFANLSINGSNEVNKGFTIRGVGTNNFHGNVNSAVGVYQDEVSMSTPFSGVLGVFDVERVEVLRGPQNTLFGRNTTGGAINYISRLPEVGGRSDGYLRGTYGENSEVNLEGALGFGLGDTAAGRFSLQSVNRDGLFTNMAPGREGEELGERDRQSARLQVFWTPRSATSILFNAHAGYSRGSNVGNKAIGIRDPDDPSVPCDLSQIVSGSDYQTRNDCVAANGFNPSSENWETVYNASGAQANIDITGGFVKVVHEFAKGYALTSISAVENTRINQADDTGGFNVIRLTPTQDGDYDQFSQELRITSPTESNLRWLAGLYYFHEDMLLGTHVVNNGPGVVASNILEQEDTDFSVYGEFDYDLSDRLTLGLGLRYTNNSKKAPSSIFRVVPRVPNGLTDPTLLITNEIVESATVVPVVIPFTDLEADLDEIGGKLYLSYTPVEAVLLYASYSEGFKSGGFDTRANAALTPGADVGRPVGPEFLSAWEFGVKSTLASGTLQLNAAAFFYTWEDLQTFVVVGGVPGFANIPESQLSGIDIEAEWAPTNTWSVTASAGWLDSEVTDVGDLAASVDDGHELPNSPAFSANVSAQKHFNVGRGRMALRADFRYSDEQKDSLLFARDAYSTKDSTTFFDLRASYTFGPESRYEVALWGENLTEERTCYDIGLVDNPAVTTRQLTTTGACSPGAGQRRIGLTGQIKF